MDKESIKAILFDLDGTLIQSEYYRWQAWVEPLEELGVDISKIDFKRYTGKTNEEIEKDIINQFNLKVKEGDILKKRDALLEKWLKGNKLELMPFAKEVLEFFKKKNYQLALCTSGRKEEVELKVKENEIEGIFDLIVTRSDVKNGKPRPDVYCFAIDKFKLKPEECLAIEDTQWGVIAAKAAGTYCFVIPSEFAQDQDFSKADKILNSLKELIEWGD